MKLCVKLQNGEEITARTEEWLAALIGCLSERERSVLFERMRRKLIAYSTPGNHILHAEGFHLGLKP
jgi:hypothetical protein